MDQARTQVWRESALALSAGAALATAQVPFSLLPLGLGGLMLAFWLMARAASWRRAALVGWLAGFGHFVLALHWIYHPFQVDAARDGWMAPFAVILMPAGLALFWAVAGGLGWWLSRRYRVLGLALALSLAETLRAFVLTGFPWVLPGHIWLGWPGEQVAALVGAHGLTLITTGIAALLLLGRIGIGMATGLGIAVMGFGIWQAGRALPPDLAQVVRLVQPNAEQHLKWSPTHWRAFYDRQLELTAREGNPDLVVWPETAVPFVLESASPGLDQMIEASRGVPLLVGIQRLEGRRGYNSLALLTLGPNGQGAQVGAVYDKHHLVPFGEYIPFGDDLFDWMNISAFAASQGMGYTPGPGPALVDLGPLGKAAALICYEAVFPYMLRDLPERPDWVVQVTNDAWFGAAVGPWQHLSLARLRAIEFGLPVLRVANTGVSAIIDARGQIRAELGLGEVGILDAALPASLPPTLYARLGDLPVWLAYLALLAGLLPWRRH